jgi:hypothetical protein
VKNYSLLLFTLILLFSGCSDDEEKAKEGERTKVQDSQTTQLEKLENNSSKLNQQIAALQAEIKRLIEKNIEVSSQQVQELAHLKGEFEAGALREKELSEISIKDQERLLEFTDFNRRLKERHECGFDLENNINLNSLPLFICDYDSLILRDRKFSYIQDSIKTYTNSLQCDSYSYGNNEKNYLCDEIVDTDKKVKKYLSKTFYILIGIRNKMQRITNERKRNDEEIRSSEERDRAKISGLPKYNQPTLLIIDHTKKMRCVSAYLQSARAYDNRIINLENLKKELYSKKYRSHIQHCISYSKYLKALSEVHQLISRNNCFFNGNIKLNKFSKQIQNKTTCFESDDKYFVQNYLNLFKRLSKISFSDHVNMRQDYDNKNHIENLKGFIKAKTNEAKTFLAETKNIESLEFKLLLTHLIEEMLKSNYLMDIRFSNTFSTDFDHKTKALNLFESIAFPQGATEKNLLPGFQKHKITKIIFISSGKSKIHKGVLKLNAYKSSVQDIHALLKL